MAPTSERVSDCSTGEATGGATAGGGGGGGAAGGVVGGEGEDVGTGVASLNEGSAGESEAAVHGAELADACERQALGA